MSDLHDIDRPSTSPVSPFGGGYVSSGIYPVISFRVV